MRRQISELIFDAYPTIAKDLLNPLVKLLQVSREACGDDIDKFLILLVVGVRTAQDKRFSALSAAELETGELDILPNLGLNTRSVAESTGIPKETVRRKLAELVEAGWIVRNGRDLCMTGKAYMQLAHVREQVRDHAVQQYEVVSNLLSDRPTA